MQYVLSFASCPSPSVAARLDARDLPSLKLGIIFSDAPEA